MSGDCTEGDTPEDVFPFGRFDEGVFAELGRVALGWSMLENQTHALLWMLVSDHRPLMHNPSRVLIAGMPLVAQWDAVEAMLSAGPTGNIEALEWFKKWRQAADKLRVRRNEAIHAAWYSDWVDVSSPSAIAVDVGSRKARLGQRWDVVPGGKDELSELATTIGRHQIELAEWQNQQLLRLNPAVAGIPPNPKGSP